MDTTVAVGKSVIRKDALDKVMGTAKFNNDVIIPGILHAKMVISRYAHARIKSIDVSQAGKAPGVQAVITGEYADGVLTGTFFEDRPILAVGKVRYFGEPVAAVVANTELEANRAAKMIRVEYEPLPVVNSPSDALKSDAPLVHENMAEYRYMKEVFPTPDTNIANHVKIRKGDMEKGWSESDVIVEESFILPQSDHAASNLGNLSKCIKRLKEMINWNEGQRIQTGDNKVRAKGISCFWKTSTTSPDAVSGAVVTFTPSGHANLSIGAVELGQGTKTTLAQILAEKLKIDYDRVSITMEVNTQDNPEHWKTVASSSNYMAGNAVVAAVCDTIRQIREISSIVLRCSLEDLEVAGGKVFLKNNPTKYLDITEVIHGYKYPNGNSIGGQVIGHGSFIMKHLTGMDADTGKGTPGPFWTLGAPAVEVELDTREYTYRILTAASVIDAGKVINPATARGVVMGGMSMGLSLASSEAFLYDSEGIMQNPQLRTYKLMRFGERPKYLVDFIETPEMAGPYGARGLGEHGLIGMPAALINSLSTAAQVDLNKLPLTPESIWRKKTGRQV